MHATFQQPSPNKYSKYLFICKKIGVSFSTSPICKKNDHIMKKVRITTIQVNGQTMVVQDHCVIHTIHLITLIEP